MRVAVSIMTDEDGENPLDDGVWTLHSFGTRHRNYTNPERLGLSLERDSDGFPIVQDIGLRSKLRAGTAFFLSYYEHGTCVWSLPGEGWQCQWDSVKAAGLLVCDNRKHLSATYEARKQEARQALAAYTAWCNGYVYGFSIASVDEDGDEIEHLDSCFGFLIADDDDARYFFDRIGECVPDGAEVYFTGDADYLARRYTPEWLKSGRKVSTVDVTI